jgi:3-polyprenyl-4-hydroxybenzoate decarboxylase
MSPDIGNAQPLDSSLRDYLKTNADIVTVVSKPVRMDDVGALSAQSDQPIVFDNIVGKPNCRLTDMLVKSRRSQGRALGVGPDDFLKTLAFRLRQPPRGFKNVETGPVKEVVCIGGEADWTLLPIPRHKDKDEAPYVTAVNIIKDPVTGL